MKLSIGLTGGIGSGKSLVSQVFRHLGVAVFNSDIEAKKLYDNPQFLKEIGASFGSSVIEEGKLNRQRLAEIVFSDKARLKRLNEMTHPQVMEMFAGWRKRQSSPYVIMESAILFENHLEKFFDRTVCVNAPIETVIRRVVLRDGCSEEEVLRRISNQMPQEKKNASADFVILHDDRTMLLPQILEIHTQLLNLSNRVK